MQEGGRLVNLYAIYCSLNHQGPPLHQIKDEAHPNKGVDEQGQLSHMQQDNNLSCTFGVECGSYIHQGKAACTNARSAKVSACSR